MNFEWDQAKHIVPDAVAVAAAIDRATAILEGGCRQRVTEGRSPRRPQQQRLRGGGRFPSLQREFPTPAMPSTHDRLNIPTPPDKRAILHHYGEHSVAIVADARRALSSASGPRAQPGTRRNDARHSGTFGRCRAPVREIGGRCRGGLSRAGILTSDASAPLKTPAHYRDSYGEAAFVRRIPGINCAGK